MHHKAYQHHGGGGTRLSPEEVAWLQAELEARQTARNMRQTYGLSPELEEDMAGWSPSQQTYYSQQLLFDRMAENVNLLREAITKAEVAADPLPAYLPSENLPRAKEPPWWCYLLIWWLGKWLKREWGSTVPIPDYRRIDYMEWKLAAWPKDKWL